MQKPPKSNREVHRNVRNQNHSNRSRSDLSPAKTVWSLAHVERPATRLLPPQCSSPTTRRVATRATVHPSNSIQRLAVLVAATHRIQPVRPAGELY